MDNFFKILYYMFLAVTVIFFTYMVSMLAIAPKKDVMKRGFIPCTEEFVLYVSDCERGEIMCPLKGIWADTLCNAGVIANGAKSWIEGTEPTPWSAYLFEPVLEQFDEDEPYEGKVSDDVIELNKQREFIKEKHEELERALNRKFNLDENVLSSNPEVEFETRSFPHLKYENEENLNDDANKNLSEENTDNTNKKMIDEKEKNNVK